MKTVRVAQASSIRNNERHDTTIVISDDCPDYEDNDYYTKYKDFYENQGRLIADALYESLPGGTWDALLWVLMEKHASILRVQTGGGHP